MYNCEEDILMSDVAIQKIKIFVILAKRTAEILLRLVSLHPKRLRSVSIAKNLFYQALLNLQTQAVD